MLYTRQINEIWYSWPIRYGVYGGYMIFWINSKRHPNKLQQMPNMHIFKDKKSDDLKQAKVGL